MDKQIPVEALRVGMFVHALDRPWIDTPFLLEGLLIETEDDITTLKRICKHVFVDPDRSQTEVMRKLDPLVRITSQEDDQPRPTGETVMITTGKRGTRPVMRVQYPEVDSTNMFSVSGDRLVRSAEYDSAKRAVAGTRKAIKQLVQDIRAGSKIEMERIDAAVDGMVQSVVRNPDALIWFTKLKDKDSYAYQHGIDVSIFLMAFGRHLGYPQQELHTLGTAGLMIDIGKLRLPTALLTKQGRLTPQEFDLMKSHVGIGLEILRDTADVPQEVKRIVSQHHEREDGSGYPMGLRGDGIPTLSAMAGIVDTFEAMVSDRPYAGAITTQQALRNLYSWKGSHFNESLVEQFMQCVSIYPVGTLVEMHTGEVGIVIGQNKVRRLKPRLMLVLDAEKKPFGFPIIVDLLHDPVAADGEPYQITKDLPAAAYNIDPREYYL